MDLFPGWADCIVSCGEESTVMIWVEVWKCDNKYKSTIQRKEPPLCVPLRAVDVEMLKRTHIEGKRKAHWSWLVGVACAEVTFIRAGGQKSIHCGIAIFCIVRSFQYTGGKYWSFLRSINYAFKHLTVTPLKIFCKWKEWK